MKRNALLSLSAAVLFLSGCAYDVVTREEQLLLNNQFAEIVERVEPRFEADPDIKTNDVMVLCVAYARLKDYQRLFKCLDVMDHHIATGRNRVYITDITYFPLQLRAEAYIELGRYAEAEAQAQKLYEMSDLGLMQRGQRIYALGYIGLARALAGNAQGARGAAEELEGIGTQYPFVLLNTPKNEGLSRIYMALGDYPRALEAIERASSESAWQSLADAVTGAAMRGESMFTWQELPKRYTLNRARLEMGQFDAARTGFDALLADPRSAENGQVYWLLLFDRGRVALHDGDSDSAIAFYKRSVDVIERQRSTIGGESSKIGFVGDKLGVYAALIDLLVQTGRHEEAFVYAERGKSRALVDLLAQRTQFAAKDLDPQSVNTMLTQMDDLERKSLYQPPSVDANVAMRTRSLEVVRTRLSEDAPELASLVTVTAPSPAEIQRHIGGDEVLVEYFYHGGGMAFVFVVTRDAITSRKIGARGLEADISAFRKSLTDVASQAWRADAGRLYDRLFAPIEEQLNKANLIVVPHGAMHYVPFAALHSGRAALIEKHSLRVLPSASVMSFLKSRGGADQNMLLLGNPDLGDPRMDLPGAELEVRAISETWQNAHVLTRREATETVLKGVGGNFRYLHLASHGKFSADDPLASRMLLAPDGQNDGILTVGEIYELNLRADLVTLSACETGMGKVANGDDVVGLTRGFLYAGANSVVASLWPVADEPTLFLMNRFYKAFKTMDKRAALRAAQLETRKRYPHPFYWASFQLTGAP